MNIIDTHCHLDMLDYKEKHQDVPDVLRKCRGRFVNKVIHICCTLESFEEVVEEYSQYPEVYFAVGIHPCYVKDAELDMDKLARLHQHPRVVAVGEIGLDSYHSTEFVEKQEDYFRKQLAFAKANDIPVIIHTRGGVGHRTLEMIEEAGVTRGVIHCFTEDQEVADRALKQGFHIGVGGISTFKNAEDLRDIIRTVPVERLLSETDAPYLAPVPNRGKENQPAFVADVVNYLAAVKGMTVEAFAQQLWKNAHDLFKLED